MKKTVIQDSLNGMKIIFIIFCMLLLIKVVIGQQNSDCKSKPVKAHSENGIFNDLYFNLLIEKTSTNTSRISIIVTNAGKVEGLQYSGYAGIFIHQRDKKISKENWDDWSDKESRFPELGNGIYSREFTNIELNRTDKISATIALNGKKGTYNAEFSLGFLKKCIGFK